MSCRNSTVSNDGALQKQLTSAGVRIEAWGPCYLFHCFSISFGCVCVYLANVPARCRMGQCDASIRWVTIVNYAKAERQRLNIEARKF